MARRGGNKTKKSNKSAPPKASAARPGTPPIGSYDPGLEAQVRAGRRGLKDLRFDTRTANQRAQQDRDVKVGELGYDYGNHVHDENLGFTRDLTDLAIQEQRGTEDYGNALNALHRRYTILGDSQAEQQAAAGVSRGGAGAAAAEKRAGNLAFERAPIDLGYNRTEYDIGQRRGRMGEDHNTTLGRLLHDYTSRQGAIGTDYGRDFSDRASKLSRAEREQGFFENDTTQQEYFQAQQTNPNIKFPTPKTPKVPKGPKLKKFPVAGVTQSVGLVPRRRGGRKA